MSEIEKDYSQNEALLPIKEKVEVEEFCSVCGASWHETSLCPIVATKEGGGIESAQRVIDRLLINKNPRQEEYRTLIKQAEGEAANWLRNRSDEGGSTMYAPHDEIWARVFTEQRRQREELVSFLLAKLKDELVVEIGARSMGYIARIADQAKAAAYIAVDAYVEPKKSKDPHVVIEADDMKNIQSIQIQADMLDFLSKLPDNSVTVVMNGIADFIDTQYAEALAKEATRVAKKGSLIFGNHSSPLPILAKNKNLLLKNQELKIWNPTYVYEKIGDTVSDVSEVQNKEGLEKLEKDITKAKQELDGIFKVDEEVKEIPKVKQTKKPKKK